MRVPLLFLGLVVLALAPPPLIACSCVRPPPGPHSPRELAELAAAGAGAIFEGTVERKELRWGLLDAKPGSLVSADFEADPLRIEVSFHVERSYRGVEEENVVVVTGLGSGDCGYPFANGEHYLVYAYEDESGQLSTGICSATAPVDASRSNLAYLRGEPDVAVDALPKPPSAGQKVCGQARASGPEWTDSEIFLLDFAHGSLLPSEKAEVAADGSFCARDVAPGRYKLLFINRSEDSPTSLVYFPGVRQESEAAAIEVPADRPVPDLHFLVAPQASFPVGGNVLASDSSLFLAAKVLLLGASDPPLMLSYSQDVGPDGRFLFSNVLAGKYWAYVMVDSDAGAKWLTRKTEIEVNGPTGGLSLELTRK